ncbi:MAG TPA: EI24 domain-containing protein [Dongiaceae bacterium]
MISSLLRGFQQLFDPPTHRLVLLSALLALGVLVGLAILLWFLLNQLQFAPWEWAQWAVDILSGIGLVLLVFLLFPAALSATVTLFLDSVAQQVERLHYPSLPPPRGQSVQAAVLGGMKLALVAIGLNILALPVYFIPIVNFFVFYLLNGYLLGREYFESVALRRLSAGEARELRRREKGRLIVAGVVITVMLTIPFLNLVAPVVATAFMLHLFESMRGTERAARA